MTPSPLRPPTLAEASEALSAAAPIDLAWPTVFDTPTEVERAWVDFAANHPPHERTLLRQALAFARARHADQPRRGSDTPYWVHVVRVALELARWGETDALLAQAALLHDVIEDTPTTLEEVQEGFGADVAELVVWLTCPPSRDRDAVDAYYARLLGDGPQAAHVLKLADRTDNLRSIQALLMRTGDRHRRWAGRYLDHTRRFVVPLSASAPSIARVTLVTAMADLAPLVGGDLTES
jgi:(p)ppGpp synthase/HD superfamily hydrolase